MNMFAKNSATNIKEYIDNVPEDRREAVKFLDKLIKKTAPKLKPHFAYNMIGYGVFKYLDYKKKVKEWPIIALANQKNYISVYVCAVDGDKYIAEKHADKLGKVNVGRSCIRFRKLENVNLDELKKVIKAAAKSPGLVGATPVKS